MVIVYIVIQTIEFLAPDSAASSNYTIMNLDPQYFIIILNRFNYINNVTKHFWI